MIDIKKCCPVCKKLISSSNIRRHLLKIHEIVTISKHLKQQCDGCNKMFSFSYISKHEGKCSSLKRMFGSTSALRSQRRRLKKQSKSYRGSNMEILIKAAMRRFPIYFLYKKSSKAFNSNNLQDIGLTSTSSIL